MPRQNRRQDGGPSRPVGGSHQYGEDFHGERFTVRAVTGSNATKPYRCPGCDQMIRPGTPHLVVWADHDLEAGDRRHWHKVCWEARERRRPGTSRRPR